jgi:hypothetical protein
VGRTILASIMEILNHPDEVGPAIYSMFTNDNKTLYNMFEVAESAQDFIKQKVLLLDDARMA